MSLRFSNRLRAVLLSVTFATSLLSLSAARADDPSALKLEAARTLFKQGIASRDRLDHAKALQEFREAQALLRSPVTALAVAQELIALGMLLEARQELLAVETIPKSPRDTKASDDARDVARKLSAQLKPRLSMVRVSVTIDPPDTPFVLRLDGTELPYAAIKAGLLVNPGDHAVEVECRWSKQRQNIALAEGQDGELLVTVDKAPAASSASASSPAPPVPPPSVSSTPPVPPPPTASRSNDAILWVGVVLAGAGLVVGSVTGELALSRAATLKTNCPRGNCPDSEATDLTAVKRFATVSTISFLAAGLGGAAVISDLLWFRNPSPSSNDVSLRPMLGFGSIGVEGAF